MTLPADRRVIIIAAAAAVLIVVIGLIILANGKSDEAAAPSDGGLKVEIGRDDKIDASRQLPCYVNGQSVGMATLDDCARRNGLQSGQLNVGIDQSGALAYGQAGAELVPLPPSAQAQASPPVTAGPPPKPVAVLPPENSPGSVIVTPVKGPGAACWRFAGDWVKLPDMTFETCVATLYAGVCERRGGAAYGRWGEQTLRLYNGRIEQSPDNQHFTTLVRQGPNCSVPAL